MCGIFAYLNYGVSRTRIDVTRKLIDGLKRLEYRGYDSAGMVMDGTDGQVLIVREVGPVKSLQDLAEKQVAGMSDKSFDKHVGMAHTRWATHGPVCIRNSHPHTSSHQNEFIVVHNGVVTNYKEIKSMLEKHGHVFESDTDTEVVAKLCLYFYKELKSQHEKIDFKKVVLKQGAYAFVFKSPFFPNEMCVARRGSPLVMGVKNHAAPESEDEVVEVTFGDEAGQSTPNRDKKTDSTRSLASQVMSRLTPAQVEYYIASDITAIVEHTNKVLYLEDDDVVHFAADGSFRFYRREQRSLTDSAQTRKQTTLEMELSLISKGNFPHYMLKEIHEQEESVLNTMRGRVNFVTGQVLLGGLKAQMDSINRCRRLIFIACGTSYHAALATRQLVEELTMLPVSLELASDFLDRSTPIFRDDTCFFVSQSGETADTLQALEYCKKRGALCVGITNTVASSIARLTDCGIHLNAGPEIGVASTKAFTSQIIAIVLIALQLGQDRISTAERRRDIVNALHKLPQMVKETLRLDGKVKEIAERLKGLHNLIVLGRGYNHAASLEAALKIKEISYIHTEGIPAGELKHGPLALIDQNMTVLVLMTRDALYSKNQNTLEQVVARLGRPIALCGPNDEFVKSKVALQDILEIPEIGVDCLQPVLNVIPLQLLSYHIAVLKGVNVDRPRNLAKSVTVTE